MDGLYQQTRTSAAAALPSCADHCQDFLDERSRHYERAGGVGWAARSYRSLVERMFQHVIPVGQRVAEIGCGTGDLLASLGPSFGVGADFCRRAIESARLRHPQLIFECCEATKFSSYGPFDYIVLSDLINDVPDVQRVFEHVTSLCHARTRLVINFFNHAWYPVVRAAEWLGLKSRALPQNWLSRRDVVNLLNIAGWELVRVDTQILWPLRVPFLATFLNRLVAPS